MHEEGVLHLSILCPAATCPLFAGSTLPKPPGPASSRRSWAGVWPGTPGQGRPPHPARALARPGMPFAVIYTAVAMKRRKPRQHQGANYSSISSQCISSSALCFSAQC